MAYVDDANKALSQYQADITAGVAALTAAATYFGRLLTAGQTWGVQNGSFKALAALGKHQGGKDRDT